jgi:hypothetical protein
MVIPRAFAVFRNITPGMGLNEVTGIPLSLKKGRYEKKIPDPIPKTIGSLSSIP